MPRRCMHVMHGRHRACASRHLEQPEWLPYNFITTQKHRAGGTVFVWINARTYVSCIMIGIIGIVAMLHGMDRTQPRRRFNFGLDATASRRRRFAVNARARLWGAGLCPMLLLFFTVGWMDGWMDACMDGCAPHWQVHLPLLFAPAVVVGGWCGLLPLAGHSVTVGGYALEHAAGALLCVRWECMHVMHCRAMKRMRSRHAHGVPLQLLHVRLGELSRQQCSHMAHAWAQPRLPHPAALDAACGCFHTGSLCARAMPICPMM